MSAPNDRETFPKRNHDESLPGRGRSVTTTVPRVFLSARHRTSRDSEERRSKKENNLDNNSIASGSALRKRKPGLREKMERPDSPAPERHPPRSTLHQPISQRSRTTKALVLGKSRTQEPNNGTPLEQHRRMQSINAIYNGTEDDRHSRPQHRPDFTVVRGQRSPSQASTLYEKLSRYSSDSQDELENLREQVERLQREVDQARQTALERQQAVEELTAELTAQKKLNKKQATQLETMVKSEKKNEELVSAIQTNLQCQICWELFTRPHVLTPCGHVYCLQCLQDWFRSGPVLEEDDEYEALRSTILRKKHCPCCRTRILLRPVELYLVKSMASAYSLAKSEAPSSASPMEAIVPTTIAGTTATTTSVASPETVDESDPWAGLFPVHNIVAGYIEELDENGNDEEGYDSDSQFRSETSSIGLYNTDEDPFYSDPGESASEHDENEDDDAEEYDDAEDGTDDVDLLSRRRYVRPPYAPPVFSRSIVLSEYPHVYGETLELLQRGATLLMIDRFDMRFDQHQGISIKLSLTNSTLYLGWNITRPGIHSLDGAELVQKLEMDLWDRPERWEVVHVGIDTYMAWRLVPEDDNGVAIPEVVGFYSDDED